MLAKCANPSCAIPFHYLRDGKVFELVLDSAGKLCRPAPHLTVAHKPVRVERFWLCANCASSMTLTYQPNIGVNVAPLHARRAAAP